MSKWLLFTTLHPSQACQDQRPYIERWVFRPHSKHERVWKYERISYMHCSFCVWGKKHKFDWFWENFGKCRWHYDFDAEITLDKESSLLEKINYCAKYCTAPKHKQSNGFNGCGCHNWKSFMIQCSQPYIHCAILVVRVESCWREVWKTWTCVRYLLQQPYILYPKEGQIISRVFARSRALAFSRCFFVWGFWVLSPWLICRKLKEETGFAAGILHSHLLMTTNHLISLPKLGTTEAYSATFLPKPALMHESAGR